MHSLTHALAKAAVVESLGDNEKGFGGGANRQIARGYDVNVFRVGLL